MSNDGGTYKIGGDFWGHRGQFYLGKTSILEEEHIDLLADRLVDKVRVSDSFQSFLGEVYAREKILPLIKRVIKMKLFSEVSLNYKYNEGVKKKRDQFHSYYPTTRLADFSYNSNQIEGSKTPYEQVKLFFETGSSLHDNEQEVQEMRNTAAVWNELQSGFSINERGIKRIYAQLTSGLFMQNGKKYPRGYRKVPMSVGESSVMNPEAVPSAMKGLLKWYHENKSSMFPLQLAFEFHYRYERIHPFRDGNGRTGRLLMNKILLSKGFFPMIVFLENRAGYFNAFEKGEFRKKRYKFMLSQYEKSIDCAGIVM